MHGKFLVRVSLALATAALLPAQYSRPVQTRGVGIDQKLNAPIPLDLLFRDETNQLVPLRTYFGDKPVVISLVYFKCTSLCPMSIQETVTSLRRVALEPGRDYNVLVISFDPSDTPAAAAREKADFKSQFNRKGYDAGFHFLTGDQQTITKFTSAVGWKYRWDEPSKQFIHAAGIMIATPEGKLSHYLFGIDYAPADLRMSLVDAAKHKIGTPVDYILLFCCHYDAATGKYTLAIFKLIKLFGCLTIIGLALLITLLMRNDQKKKMSVKWEATKHA
jgi:protein SCO1/2